MKKNDYRYIFCDEAAIKENFFVIGGLYGDKIKILNTIKDILELKRKYHLESHEIKFIKCNNNQKLELYTEIIKVIFENKLDYRCCIFDSTQINHKKYNNCENYEKVGFYKLYYQVLYFNFMKSNPKKFKIFIDERNNKSNNINLINLKSCLNGLNLYDKVKTLVEIDSHKCLLIQASDLISGCIGMVANQRNTKQYKIQLGKNLSEIVKLQDISEDTGWRRDFKVWRWSPKE